MLKGAQYAYEQIPHDSCMLRTDIERAIVSKLRPKKFSKEKNIPVLEIYLDVDTSRSIRGRLVVCLVNLCLEKKITHL